MRPDPGPQAGSGEASAATTEQKAFAAVLYPALRCHASRIVGSSLVSFACVRPRSAAFGLALRCRSLRCRSRTRTALGGLASRARKAEVGGSIRPNTNPQAERRDVKRCAPYRCWATPATPGASAKLHPYIRASRPRPLSQTGASFRYSLAGIRDRSENITGRKSMPVFLRSWR